MAASPSGSMSGWSFATWLDKNKESVKLFIVAGASVGTFYATKSLSPEWQAVILPVIAIATKLLVDTIDFYVSEVELPQ